jgi:hypothetical protein
MGIVSPVKSEDDFGHPLSIAKNAEIWEGSIFRLKGLLAYAGRPDGHGVDAGTPTCDFAPELLEAVSQNNSPPHQTVKQPWVLMDNLNGPR